MITKPAGSLKRAVKWTVIASEAISQAGGVPAGVLNGFSEETLQLLIHNDIDLKYRGEK